MANYRIISIPSGNNFFVGSETTFSLEIINNGTKNIKIEWMSLTQNTIEQNKYLAAKSNNSYSEKVINKKQPKSKYDKILNADQNEESDLKLTLKLGKKGLYHSKRYKVKWKFNGKYRIVCIIKYPNGKSERITHDVNVINKDNFITYTDCNDPKNPFSLYQNLEQQINVIYQLAVGQHLSEKDQKEFDKRMDTLHEMRRKFNELLHKIPDSHVANFEPFYKPKLDTADNHGKPMIVEISAGYFYDPINPNEVYLIDWTNLLVQGLCGVRKGKTKNGKISYAIFDAINTWRKNNRYLPGKVSGKARIPFECVLDDTFSFMSNVPEHDVPKEEWDQVQLEQAKREDINILRESDGAAVVYPWLEFEFHTNGKTNADEWSDFFSGIALVATIAAGIITLCLPVPGSQVVSALIWTSIAASTASAVINIVDRHQEGFSNWKEDGLDALTLVGNILSAGTMSIGTQLATRSLNLVNLSKTTALKIGFWGQLTADSLQGLAMVPEFYDAFMSLLNDKTMPADMKYSRLAMLLTRGITTGIIYKVSIKSNIKALKGLKNADNSSLSKVLTRQEIDDYITGKKQFAKNISSTEANEISGSIKNEKPSKTSAKSSKNEESIDVNKNKKPSKTSAESSIDEEQQIIDSELSESNTLQTMIDEKYEILSNSDLNISNDGVIQTVTSNKNKKGKTYSVIIPDKKITDFMIKNKEATPDTYLEKLLTKNLEEGKKVENLKESAHIGQEGNELDVSKGKSNSNKPVTEVIAKTGYGINEPDSGTLKKLRNSVSDNLRDNNATNNRVALSLTRCEELSIESQIYHNIRSRYKYLKNKGVIKAIDADHFEIVDIREYFLELVREYNIVNNPLHHDTYRLIKDFIIANNGKLHIINGLPGTHAEILSTNDVIQQLAKKNVDRGSKQIQVSTIRLKEKRWKEAFPACSHCSGILNGNLSDGRARFVIETGRYEKK